MAIYQLDIQTQFLHLLACQFKRRCSGSRSGSSHRQSLSRDAQRVKTHTVMLPCYGRQLISKEHVSPADTGAPGCEQERGARGRTGAAGGHKGNGWDRAASCLPRDPAHLWPPHPGKERSTWLCPRIPLPSAMQMKPFPELDCWGSSCQNAQRLQWEQDSAGISQRGEMQSATVKRCWCLLATF